MAGSLWSTLTKLVHRIYNKKLKVHLSKSVEIENTRLELLHILLQCIVIAVPIIVFYENREYLRIEVPQAYPNIWAETPTDGEFKIATAADMQSDFCTRSYTLNYKYSNAFTYLNFSCLEMSTSELFFKVGKDIIYFPTYFHEQWEESISDSVGAASPTPCDTLTNGLPRCPTGEWLGGSCYKANPCPSGESCSQMCSVKRRSHFFTVGVASMLMAFSHFFEVEGPDEIVAGYSSNTIDAALAEDRIPVLTVVYSQKASAKGVATQEFDCNLPSEGMCRFAPGESLMLTLNDWLRAANINLDDENNNVRANRWNITDGGSQYAHPVLRITGAEIMISVKYEAPDFHSFKHSGTWGSTWPYAVCSIMVKGSPAWTGMPQNRYEKLADAGNKHTGHKMRQRWYEGVRFIFVSSTASQWGFFTYSEMLIYLASMIVYFSLADWVVTVIATHGLGATSKTYSKAKKEPLCVKQQCTQGLPSRLLQSTMAFYALTGFETMGKENAEAAVKTMQRGLSFETLHRVFKSIMEKYEEIDSDELAHLSRKVFDALSADGERVRLSEFCEATSSNETFDVQSLVDAFDWDRKKGLFEAVFKDGSSVRSRKHMELHTKARRLPKGVEVVEDVESPTPTSNAVRNPAPTQD